MRRVPVTAQRDDAPGRARRSAASTETEQALVTRLQALSTEFATHADPEFRAATRQRLVAMAAVRTPEAATRRPPVRAGVLRRLLARSTAAPSSRGHTRLTAGLAGAALTVTALGGLFGAAQGARPGDLLYDLKRGGEQTQLALASDSSRGPTLLEFASTRLDELGELVGVDPNADAVVGTTPSGGEVGLAAGPDVDLVLDTLQTMDAETTEGTAALTTHALDQTDPGALRELTGWAADQQSGLAELMPAVPAGAQGAVSTSRALVEQVAARGTALEQALACAGGPSTAGADQLGPLPTSCPAAPPATAGTQAPSASGSVPSDSLPSGSLPSGSLPSGAPAATSGAPTGTAAPGATSGALPTGALPTGGIGPTVAAPSTSARPGVPLPSLPGLPGLPTTSAAPRSSSGAIVSVPAPVPGVKLCAPPLITVGC
jgi:hypothetical protein